MMTIPFRPAPPPPPSSTSTNSSQNLHNHNANNSIQLSSQRNEFQLADAPSNLNEKQKKIPPPRPPPPKHHNNANNFKTFELKKPEHQSINILSNFFGSSQSINRSSKTTTSNKSTLLSRKIDSPPAFKLDDINTSIELISFDSPPASPQFTAKFSDNQRTSSANSFESNSLQSNSSGFSSGALSTLTNSGFEEDYFSLGTTSSNCSNKAWQNIDPFSPISHDDNHQSMFNTTQIQSNSYGDSTFYASTNDMKTLKKNAFPIEFDDSLSNGKSLLKPEPALAMPTIIRPTTIPMATNKQPKNVGQTNNYESLKSFPVLQSKSNPLKVQREYASNNISICNDEQSYGIALYDFDAVHDGDLSLKINDKVYLIRQIDNEWYYGKNKRGCEGIFPSNYINVVIPIQSPEISVSKLNVNEMKMNSSNATATTEPLKHESYTVKTMYDFVSEIDGDLTIRVNAKFRKILFEFRY